MKGIAGDEPVQAVGAAAAGLEFGRQPALLACQPLHRAARVLEAVLGSHRQRAAQRVQAEQRVGARHQGQRCDRRLGNQVPADDIAERLVQAHAVEVDRQALRRAQQGRRGEAAEVDIGLERVVLHLVEMHAAQPPVEEAAQVDGMAALDLAAHGGLHIGRHPVLGHVQPGQGGGADDVHLLRCGLRQRGLGGQQALQREQGGQRDRTVDEKGTTVQAVSSDCCGDGSNHLTIRMRRYRITGKCSRPPSRAWSPQGGGLGGDHEKQTPGRPKCFYSP